jgi:hypothetical protein
MEKKEYVKIYNHNNIHRRITWSKNRRIILKKEIHSLLGNRCIVCGYTGLALQIDHVNGHGTEERKSIGNGTKQCNLAYLNYVLKKIKNGSRGYQLLCANHNIEKYLKKG